MAGLVRVHLARKDGAEALRWATRLTAKQPKDGVSQLLLGDALALRGDEDGAREAWTRAAERGNATAKQRLE
jgi:Flp pilus assembly protein TadD